MHAVAIGYSAGQTSQGKAAIAIGAFAGESDQHAHSVVVNASGAALATGSQNAFYVSSVRLDSTNVSPLVSWNLVSNEVVTIAGVNAHASNASMELSGNLYASNLYGNGSALVGISTASTLQEIVELGNSATNTIQLEGNSMALATQGNVSIGSLVNNHTNLHVTGNVHTTGNIKTVGNVIASDLYGDGTNVVYSGLTSSSQFTFPNASGKLSSVSNVAWNTSSQSGYPSEFLDISGNVVFSNGNVEMTTSDLHVFDVHLRDLHHADGRIRFTHPGSGSESEFRLENTEGNELSLNVIPAGSSTNTVAMNVASDGNVHFTQNVHVGGNTHSNIVTGVITFQDGSSITTGSGLNYAITGATDLAGGGVEVDSIKLTRTVLTPTFLSGVLTVDGFQRAYSVHHYVATADITEIAAGSNINNGDQVVVSITNTTAANVTISTGGTNNKSNFTEPSNVRPTETSIVTGIKLTGNMHFSTSVFS
jgi:hypothetical protein